MPKKYNISSKTDMRRLEKDLEKQVKDIAVKKALTMNHFVQCPHCTRKVTVMPGNYMCPFCKKGINLKITL